MMNYIVNSQIINIQVNFYRLTNKTCRDLVNCNGQPKWKWFQGPSYVVFISNL